MTTRRIATAFAVRPKADAQSRELSPSAGAARNPGEAPGPAWCGLPEETAGAAGPLPAPSDVEVRAAGPDDVEAIAAISGLPGYRHGTLRLPFRGLQETRRRVEGIGAGDVLLVAERGGAVVGTAGWTRFEGRRHHVASIGMGVHDDHVGRGVGTVLLGALVEAADRWYGLRRLELDVYTDNARAIALYRRFGFEDEGVSREDAFRDGRYADTLRMARLHRAG